MDIFLKEPLTSVELEYGSHKNNGFDSDLFFPNLLYKFFKIPQKIHFVWKKASTH
jgi:hypothetical protein